MREVMPSQVVAVIDRDFPFAALDRERGSLISASEAPSLRAVVDLIDSVPDNLMTCSPEQYADVVHARAVILSTLERWRVREVEPMPMARDGKDTVTVLRSSLAACRDENPPAVHANLLFISDAGLRDSIRLDVGGAHRALANSEWKAATVLAGSAIEALLYWRLSLCSDVERAGGIAVGRSRGLSSKPDSASLDRWILNEYVHVAWALDYIKDVTAGVVFHAKDYRNLIHPGAAIRVKAQCGRASSHVAIGAMEGVIADLTP
ncbi:MAG: hypothetical protein U1E60_22355 [Reyranellaceae bacterium]